MVTPTRAMLAVANEQDLSIRSLLFIRILGIIGGLTFSWWFWFILE